MGIALATVSFLGNSVRAARIPRIELLRQVRVASANVLLSDLLPASAPDSLRARAEGISLGAAPMAGDIRILERDAVERHAGMSEDVLAAVSVPERVVVSRDSRPITLTEVFAAVRIALQQKAIPDADTLRPEDILLESQVLVNPGDSGLQVMRMDLDRGLRRARFLMWPSRDPKVLPFFVTARLGGDSPLGPAHSAMPFDRVVKNINPPAGATRTTNLEPKKEILVAQGERATLMLHSDVMRIFVDVVSLEHGTLGQQIRVRMPDSGKILNAQVDGRAHLEVKF